MKGNTNNPNGRPKGTANKITTSLRGKIDDLLNENWHTVQSDLNSLEPKDRLMFLEKLLSFAVPKLASTSAEVEVKNKLDKLTEQQLDIMIENVLNEHQDD